MEKNKQAIHIGVLAVCSAIIMSVVDGVIHPPYAIKSLIKVLLFLLVPALYFLGYKEDFASFRRLFVPNKKWILKMLLPAVVCFIGIAGGYLLLRDYIDFSNVATGLNENAGVTKDNFLWVGIYISFINSLLEEVFFRGFAFTVLKRHTSRRKAYLFSAVVFAFYHVGMTFGLVNFGLFALGFIGLVFGGLIFNHLVERSGCIETSWMVHMFINFGINTVGWILLNQ